MRHLNQKNSQGELVGFDIDLAKELCKRINTQCTFVENPLDALIPSLKAKKIDAIMSSLSITEKRQQEIAFTDKLYAADSRLVVAKKFRHSADSRVAERQAGRRIAGHHPGRRSVTNTGHQKALKSSRIRGRTTFILT